VQRGPSAHVEGARGSTGGSGSNIGPSALGCRIVRAPRGLSAGASWTVRACRAQVGPGSQVVSQQAGLLSSQTRTKHPPPLFLLLSLSLKKRPPPWGFRLGHSPDRSGTSTDSLRGSPSCHPGIFSNNSLYLSDFEQEGG
jgi:hypothetical protein